MVFSLDTRLGPYEILAPLGAGGMGEVYRARDTRLGRVVAIKVLSARLSSDAASRERFEREARSVAALSHPHICTLHDVGEHEGRAFLVMELLEGQTLAARLARAKTGLPISEALAIATAVAEALACAHRLQLVHRDIKPANIMLTANGTVKVLDFGLAKLLTDSTGATSSDATQTVESTEPGIVLGTAAYMSPEQAIGAAVDGRTDIFSFGCVLFEMLSGCRAFDGANPGAIRSQVISAEPPWSRLPRDLSPRVREITELCLAKALPQRRQSIADVRLDLERAQAVTTDRPPTAPVMGAAAWAIAVVAAVGTAVAILWPAAESQAPASEMRVEITTPRTQAPHEIALSPDGRTLAFVAASGGPSGLWLRSLDSLATVSLTDGGSFPFWSADGQSIAFFANGALHRLDLTSRSRQTLAPAPIGRGGSWSAGDIILFALQESSPIQQVPAAGGEVRTATRLEAGHAAHRFPVFLPDGQHFIYFVAGDVATQGIYLGALDGRAGTRLTPADSAATILPPDQIIYNTQGVIVARRLDLKQGSLTGAAQTVVDVAPVNPFSALGVSVSARGEIAYRAWTDRRVLRWFDRFGTPLGDLGDADVSGLRVPRLSPDGRWIALDRAPLGNRDLWTRDLATGAVARLTTDRALDGLPVWSPDARRLAFHSDRSGSYDIYVKDVSGTAPEVPVVRSPGAQRPLDWSSDGRFLLFADEAPSGGLRALPMAGIDRTPITISNSEFAAPDAVLSPDGDWVAYPSRESGRYEIVVQSFPRPERQFQVSNNGGLGPRWSPDGRELYFIAPDAKLMTVPRVRSTPDKPFGRPTVLFQTRIINASLAANKGDYDVSADGRFVINEAFDDVQAPITLILNWKRQ